MAERLTPEQLKAMYPATYKPTLAEQVGLSSDPRVRAMQIRYPASPSMWGEPLDLGKELARLEALAAENAKTYPNSPEMIAWEVNASRCAA